MKRWIGAAGLVLVALLAQGCGEETFTNPTGCSEVASVRMSATNEFGQRTLFVQIGHSLLLDAEPRNAEGAVVAQVCHAPAVIWRYTPETCTLVGETAGFNPGLLAEAVGVCEVRAIVGGVTGELAILVLP